MKKFIITILSVVFCAASFNSAMSQEERSQEKALKSTHFEDSKFKEFLTLVFPKETAFRELYEESRLVVVKVVSAFKVDESLDVGLQGEAFGIIRKAQRKLEEFREVATTFQNSSNPNIRKSVRELLKINEYGNVVLQQRYNFVLHPNEFLSSDDGINKLNEYSALLKEQYEYVFELLKEISEVELTEPKEEAEKVEFQYSQEELKAMDKWKNKTMSEMIFDANNGDAVALYMLGMAHLYGQGGFPINVEQADRYFATSALLGFAPAMDKIKGMYLDDNNPNPFLVFVYVNLTASFGHPEFTMIYHNQRKCIVEKFGNTMANEIERIATQKTMKIYKAMNQLSESKDKMKTAFNFLFVEDGIIGEDAEFGVEYWEKFFNKKNS
jgi:TPR repeat protein